MSAAARDVTASKDKDTNITTPQAFGLMYRLDNQLEDGKSYNFMYDGVLSPYKTKM